MDAKLTLKLNKKVIDRAKRYARKHNTSLSKMLESYLNTLTSAEETDIPITPTVNELRGIISLPEGADYKELYRKRLDDKYGSDQGFH